MRPFERKNLIDVWSDSKIRVGQDWRKEIKLALDHAAVAIFLISADFLASDFIITNELPPLLTAAKRNGLEIIPVILKPCAFTEIDELSRLQCINDPQYSVLTLNEAETEKLWYKVAIAARDSLQQTNNVCDVHESSLALKSTKYSPDNVDYNDLLSHDYLSFFYEELRNPSIVDEYFVYWYYHLDTLVYMHDATTILKQHPSGEMLISRIKSHLSNHGWEGDGVLQLLWLPPFVGAGIEDTWGICVWHVKQSNNGTSWLASPVPLDFERLAEQNQHMRGANSEP
jgi:hypothetical protein